jgi:hypothetical protein
MKHFLVYYFIGFVIMFIIQMIYKILHLENEGDDE